MLMARKSKKIRSHHNTQQCLIELDNNVVVFPQCKIFSLSAEILTTPVNFSVTAAHSSYILGWGH